MSKQRRQLVVAGHHEERDLRISLRDAGKLGSDASTVNLV
jgi:hypothetical protein